MTKNFEEELVNRVYRCINETDEDSGYDILTSLTDSFGKVSVITNSEPEDAIWGRDLSTNFYKGIEVGVRNLLVLLSEKDLKQIKRRIRND